MGTSFPGETRAVMIMHLVYRMKGGCKSKKTSERLLACLLALFQTNKQALSFSFAASLCQKSRQPFACSLVLAMNQTRKQTYVCSFAFYDVGYICWCQSWKTIQSMPVVSVLEKLFSYLSFTQLSRWHLWIR